ncbi:MAG: DUF1512 family protein [Candidatus Aenigmarchaeota archaeon]|nr:DUF1512 family protein [Candidatus Aenigmarchaeota archaeon]
MAIFNDFGTIANIIWIVLFVAMIFLYPKMMITQMLWKLDQTLSMLDGYTKKAKGITTRKISKSPSKELSEKIENFLEFFAIQPVNLDPYGIVKKIEHIEVLSEKRFKHFVKRVAPKMSEEEQANTMMTLAGTMSLNQISKIVKHFIELIKKTKSWQLGLILQMQLPLIERISKALLRGTEAFANGWPVGDSVGGMVVAKMAGKSEMKPIEEDTVMARKRIKGKSVILIKAGGPGGRLGRLGKAVEKMSKRQKVAKIITVDAAAKLEGEKTGSVAEGVGVAIGGLGVDRAYIESLAVSKDIPLDTFVIKMSQEEAIMPMHLDVLKSSGKVVSMVEDNIAETRERGVIIVVGVGNTCGIGNDAKSVESADRTIRKAAQIMKRRDEEEKPKKRWWDFGF